MAKVIRDKLPPDHPIFKGGLQTFVPVSRPSTKPSKPVTDGAKPKKTTQPQPSPFYHPKNVSLPDRTEDEIPPFPRNRYKKKLQKRNRTSIP